MLPLLVAMVCCTGTAFTRAPAGDTLAVPSLSLSPALDGRVGASEYGAAPTASIATPAGEVRLWLARHGGNLYIAATLPDSTYYWGDDLVISLDADGSGGAGPAPGDRQWYLRRATDSSYVTVVASPGGRWVPAGLQPTPLGKIRSTSEWELASESSAAGWSLELRVPESVAGTSARAARVAFRTFNDDPQGWWSWPLAPDGRPGHHVERVPDLWRPIRFR